MYTLSSSYVLFSAVLDYGLVDVRAGLCDTLALGDEKTDTCWNGATICTVAYRTNGDSCRAFCSSFGLTCTDGWAADTTCESRDTQKGCDSKYVRQVCECTASTLLDPTPNPSPSSGPSPGGTDEGPTWHKYGGYLRAEGWRLILADELGANSKPISEDKWEEDGYDREYHETRLYDKLEHDNKDGKSRSNWVQKKTDGHIRWELRENRGPSATIWKSFSPKSLSKEGDKITLKMQWNSEPLDDDAALSRCPDKYKWKENNDHLRCLAGTGDFRLGLFNARGKAMTDMDNLHKWPAYQVRFNPHVDRDGKNHIGKNDESNASFWWRMIFAHPSAKGLLDDWCQDAKQCGFKKLEHDGEKKFPLASEAPFKKWYNVDVVLERKGGKIKSTLIINDKPFELDAFADHLTKDNEDEVSDKEKDETRMLNIDAIDAVAISYNNFRPYRSLQIRDVSLEGRDGEDQAPYPTPAPAPSPSPAPSTTLLSCGFVASECQDDLPVGLFRTDVPDTSDNQCPQSGQRGKVCKEDGSAKGKSYSRAACSRCIPEGTPTCSQVPTECTEGLLDGFFRTDESDNAQNQCPHEGKQGKVCTKAGQTTGKSYKSAACGRCVDAEGNYGSRVSIDLVSAGHVIFPSAVLLNFVAVASVFMF